MKLLNDLLLVLIVVVISAVSGYLGAQYGIPEEQIRGVVALDILSVVEQIPSDAPNKEQLVAQVIYELRQRAKEMADEGYIVIDGSLVFSAPEDAYVR